jgi:hypothetical protein
MKQVKLPIGQGELDECAHNECDHVCEKVPKHTKGPWFIQKATDDGEVIDIADGDMGLELQLVSYNGDRNRANAALISAAPELLEALEHVQKYIERVNSGLEEVSAKDLTRISVSVLGPAIRKATGGES